MRHDVLGLQAFVIIAERGSFHAAAAHLNLTQTALSHRIRKLEDSLSTELLIRTTRRVTLTPAGLALLPTARKLFEELDGALSELRAASKERHSRLSLACLPTVAVECLPPAIHAFARLYPDVEIRIFDNSAREIAERVQNGEAELGITILAANRWDFEARAVIREPFVLLCHRDHPKAACTSLTWTEIEGLQLVRISTETGNRVLIDDALGARRESLRWQYEAQRLSTAVSLVAAGIACAIVPRLAVPEGASPDLVAVPLRSPTISRTLGIITRKGNPLSAPAKDMIDLVVQSLRSRMPGEDPMNDHE